MSMTHAIGIGVSTAADQSLPPASAPPTAAPSNAVADLLAKTRAAAEARAAEEKAAYRQLVVDVAAGKPHDPAALAELLDAVGTTPAEFEAAVRLEVNRVAWQRQAAELPRLMADREKVEAQQVQVEGDLEAAIQAAQGKAAQQRAPLIAKRVQLETAIRTAQQARAQLADTAPPSDVAKLAEAKRRLDEAAKEMGRKGEVLRTHWQAMERAKLAREGLIGGLRDQERAEISRREELARELMPDAEAAHAEARAAWEQARSELDAITG